jgi:hypothetical protein
MATYSFLDVNAAINGPGGSFSLSDGGVANEGITTAMAGDKNTMTAGANGDIMHSLHASRAGRITVRVLKTGIVNSQLSKLYNYQTTSSAYHGQNTIRIANPATGDVITGKQMAFVKLPDNVNAAEGNVMEWAFDGLIDQVLGIGAPVAL